MTKKSKSPLTKIVKFGRKTQNSVTLEVVDGGSVFKSFIWLEVNEDLDGSTRRALLGVTPSEARRLAQNLDDFAAAAENARV